jgi:hypothetical protein
MHIHVSAYIWLYSYVSWLIGAISSAYVHVYSEHSSSADIHAVNDEDTYIYAFLYRQCMCLCICLYFGPDFMHSFLNAVHIWLYLTVFFSILQCISVCIWLYFELTFVSRCIPGFDRQNLPLSLHAVAAPCESLSGCCTSAAQAGHLLLMMIHMCWQINTGMYSPSDYNTAMYSPSDLARYTFTYASANGCLSPKNVKGIFCWQFNVFLVFSVVQTVLSTRRTFFFLPIHIRYIQICTDTMLYSAFLCLYCMYQYYQCICMYVYVYVCMYMYVYAVFLGIETACICMYFVYLHIFACTCMHCMYCMYCTSMYCMYFYVHVCIHTSMYV